MRYKKIIFKFFALSNFLCLVSSEYYTLNRNVSNSQSRYYQDFEGTRSVFQLGHMIKCVTGCQPLAYRRYGCFCGLNGSGTPVNVIDGCCLEHDWCYAQLRCPPFMLYVLRYAWLCKRPGQAQCMGGNYGNAAINRCAFKLCECDRLFAKCVSRFSCPQKKAVCWSNPIIAISNLVASFS